VERSNVSRSSQRAGRDAAGREAERPSEIPPRGWFAILRRVKTEVKDDNVALLAAGVAFYAMLAIFPAIIAVVTVYGMVADPQQVQSQVGEFADGLPEGAGELITNQLEGAVDAGRQALSIGLAASLLGVLWSASSGVQGLVKGLNIVYDEKETRGFLKLRGLSLLLTLGAIVVAVVALALIAVFPGFVEGLGLGRAGELAASIARWVILGLLVLGALAVVYRFAPDRANPRWRWVSGGAVVALVLWLLGSFGFSYYVDNFGKYNETYGALAAVIILLLWLFLSAFIVLLGAEFDAETERQTVKDTTSGPSRPMGERDAEVADTLGDSPQRR
jgi:membrane protein